MLHIQKTRIFMLYKKHGKAVGDTLLPEGSLKYYLENSRAYLGEKLMRYDVYYKGIVQCEQTYKNKDGSLVKQSTSQRSYCFDYCEIVKAYDINLEKSSPYSNESMDEEEDEHSSDEEDEPPSLQQEFDFGKE